MVLVTSFILLMKLRVLSWRSRRTALDYVLLVQLESSRQLFRRVAFFIDRVHKDPSPHGPPGAGFPGPITLCFARALTELVPNFFKRVIAA